MIAGQGQYAITHLNRFDLQSATVPSSSCSDKPGRSGNG
jgi:hypothetical protein